MFFLKTIRKNRFSDPKKPERSISVLKLFGKIDFHYAGEVTHPNCVYVCWRFYGTVPGMYALYIATSTHDTSPPPPPPPQASPSRQGHPSGFNTVLSSLELILSDMIRHGVQCIDHSVFAESFVILQVYDSP